MPSDAQDGLSSARPASPSPLPLLPTSDDAGEWRAYWQAHGTRWRTEAEIGADRQRELIQRQGVTPDIQEGIYPFRDVKLSRADIEWLLATHEHGRGPVRLNVVGDEEREGLDLRGADLGGVDLSDLPLDRVRGSLTVDEWPIASEEQRRMATVKLAGANLSRAYLQGAHLIRVQLENVNMEQAVLNWANLQGTFFAHASLRQAQLRDARLEGAFFQAGFGFTVGPGTQVDNWAGDLAGTWLGDAHLEGAYLSRAYLAGSDLLGACLDGAYLSRASLRGARLASSSLAGTNLQSAHMEGADFDYAHLEGKSIASEDLQRIRQWSASFPAELPSARLQHATLDAGTKLDGINLGRGHYGIAVADVAWGGTNLTVVDWGQLQRLGDEREAREPHKSDGTEKSHDERLRDFQAAVRAYRQLAVALQQQGLTDEAMRFTYRGQVMRRKVLGLLWKSEYRHVRRLIPWLFSWFLFLLAGYGYRFWHSAVVHLLVNVIFGLLYWTMASVPWNEAFFVSIAAFHGRGFQPDLYRPGQPGTYISGFEAVFGLVIEATLIATLTQRFFSR